MMRNMYNQEMIINNGDYVPIKKGISNVTCIHRLHTTFKLVLTPEEYTFNLSKVLAELPTPKPFGGIARPFEMLSFSVDFGQYYNTSK